MLADLGRFDDALADCNRTLELDALHPGARSRRGWVLQGVLRYDEALADHDEAIRRFRRDGRALYRRALVHVDRRRFDLARADLRRAAEVLGPSHFYKVYVRALLEVVEGLGTGRFDARRFPRPEELSTRQRGRWTAWLMAHRALGHMASGDLAAARGCLAAPVVTGEVLGRYVSAWLALGAGRAREALEGLSHPPGGQFALHAHRRYWIGRAHMALGDHARALDSFRVVRHLAPGFVCDGASIEVWMRRARS